MTTGLLAKTRALSPLHLWLPPAHAGAPAAASAVLSALVVKARGSRLRLWFDAMPACHAVRRAAAGGHGRGGDRLPAASSPCGRNGLKLLVAY